MHNKNVELIILVYLLATFCIPSSLGLYRRHIDTNQSVNFADWDVSLNQSGVSSSIQLVENGSNVTYALNVSSNSEVDVVYDVIISNIPSGVVVKIDDDIDFRIPSNGTVTITNAGTILYSNQSHQNTHTLYFKANSGATAVSNQTVNIDVDFKQA